MKNHYIKDPGEVQDLEKNIHKKQKKSKIKELQKKLFYENMLMRDNKRP